MALTDESNGTGMVMPVSPMYGGGNGGFGNFGGDWGWIILLLLIAGGGWGNGFGGYGGMGGFAADGAMLYPWMNQAEVTTGGFQNLSTQNHLTAVQSDLGDIQTQLCNGFSGVNATVNSGFAQAEIANNSRQIANMQQAFNAQTAVTAGMNDIGMSLQNCCCENRANIADLKYTVATENCADRTAAAQNTRDIIDSQNRGTQAILDKLCQLELDGVKAQVDAKNDRIVDLQNQLNMATLRESQVAQNAFIQNGLNNEVDALYNRLSNCPVPTTPVYGRTPIFTCNSGNGCGCGCGGTM